MAPETNGTLRDLLFASPGVALDNAALNQAL